MDVEKEREVGARKMMTPRGRFERESQAEREGRAREGDDGDEASDEVKVLNLLKFPPLRSRFFRLRRERARGRLARARAIPGTRGAIRSLSLSLYIYIYPAKMMTPRGRFEREARAERETPGTRGAIRSDLRPSRTESLAQSDSIWSRYC